jgi:hypothetical protein
MASPPRLALTWEFVLPRPSIFITRNRSNRGGEVEAQRKVQCSS